MRSRDIQSLIILPPIFIIAFFCFANGPTNTVVVKYPGVKHLHVATQERLHGMAVDLLRTSNFNSFSHSKLLGSIIPKIQQRYRKTISGHYMVISFDGEQKFKTHGGDVRVFEIVIGLNSSEYADALFTIDPEGRVIEHAKYSGTKCIEILKAVNEAAKRR